jgi:hypothetical protein
MSFTRRNAVLAVLAGALAVPTFLQWRADAETFVDVGAIPLLFDGFTSDNVGFVMLSQPKKEQPAPDASKPGQPPQVAYDRIAFQRSDKGWMLASGELQGAPVTKDRVESDVFAHLRSIRSDREVLVQPDATQAQLEQFGLDEAHAFVVQVRDQVPTVPNSAVIAELLVGRDAGTGQTGTEAVRGVFVRKSDSTDVVLYELDKGWLRSVETEQWLDKVIAKLEPDKVQRIAIKNAATGVRITFAREPGKASWHAVEPPPGLGAVRQAEVENLVQRLRWIGVQDFRSRLAGANLAQLGLQPPQLELELMVREGDRERVIQLGVGNKVDTKNEYYLIAPNDSAFLMTWPAGVVAPFELDAKTMFDPPSPDAQKPGDEKKGDEKKGEK